MHNVHCCCYLGIKKFDVYLLIYQHRQCTTSIGAIAPHGRSNSSYYLCKNKNKRQIVLANRFFNFSFIISRERNSFKLLNTSTKFYRIRVSNSTLANIEYIISFIHTTHTFFKSPNKRHFSYIHHIKTHYFTVNLK